MNWIKRELTLPITVSGSRSSYKYGPVYIMIRNDVKLGEMIIPRISISPDCLDGYHNYKMIPRTGMNSQSGSSKWDCMFFAFTVCKCEGWDIVEILED